MPPFLTRYCVLRIATEDQSTAVQLPGKLIAQPGRRARAKGEGEEEEEEKEEVESVAGPLRVVFYTSYKSNNVTILMLTLMRHVTQSI